MSLSRQRAFVTPEPGEDRNALARRALPDEPVEAAVARLKSGDLHLSGTRFRARDGTR